MNSRDPLRLPLGIAAAYVLVLGVVQLVPSLAEVVFGRAVVDPAVESLLGAQLFGIGLIAAALAWDRRRSKVLVWALAFGFLLSSADLGVYWALGEYDARTALVPVVVNLAFAAWIGSSLVQANGRRVVPSRPA